MVVKLLSADCDSTVSEIDDTLWVEEVESESVTVLVVSLDKVPTVRVFS